MVLVNGAMQPTWTGSKIRRARELRRVSSQPPLAFLGNFVSVVAAVPDVRAASSRFSARYGR